MRQSQKSNRTRSRGRKPSNPLSRSYDSNGPDVKIRGTASHIAEKYQSLARDALASGDIVMAENYYQHAEHYLRIIAAAQPSNRDDSRAANGNGNNQSNGHAEQAPAENNHRKPVATEITGDEPQPEIVEIENTAVEMEVAVVEDVSSEGEQPSVDAPSDDKDDEETAQPRRRRRTTYRSRKRPAAGEEDGDAKPRGRSRSRAKAAAPSEPDAPQPVVADD